ncbi:MAG: DNA ligase [Marinagarivorans sp.]|nr:DNA ligase [Marinagarivorans sp.]
MTTQRKRAAAYFFAYLALFLISETWASPPSLLLANVYNPEIHDIDDYWVSEKYDGVRAFWDGGQFTSRGGHTIFVPEKIIAQLPLHALDGELWAGRDNFNAINTIIKKENADTTQWQSIRFMVFDAPLHDGTFNERYAFIQKLYEESVQPSFWQPVKQYKVANQQELHNKLVEMVRAKGEGLMLHKGSSLYKGLRSDDLLKVKMYEDAEATVVAITQGKGKYQGMMGALKVRTEHGIIFKIGAGFNDNERKNPPPVGSLITYKYFGFTHKGTPRFASFLRIREQD